MFKYLCEKSIFMNIMLLGSGGREHALAWKLVQSPQCDNLLIVPGNAGTASLGTNIPVPADDVVQVGELALQHQVQMIVVGPEGPLAAGIYDYFQETPALQHIPVIGPSRAAAQLESSKAFAKAFMMRHQIPTARYASFTGEQAKEARLFVYDMDEPIVLKADGLAAGKGVLICDTYEQAIGELGEILGGKFGTAGSRVVIEEFLDGIEMSVFVFTDGTHYRILPTAKDYKRAGEFDTGLNTGGMGAISPVPFATPELMAKVEERIIRPTISGLSDEGLVYKGVIYFGLMIVEGEPWVIEYNARFGDPEAEVLVPRIESDLVDICQHIAAGTLDKADLSFDMRPNATIMLVAGGYPGSYEKGKPISGLDQAEGSLVFHAGTALRDGQVVTDGGRVLAVTSFGNTLEEALERSRTNAERIQWESRYYRRDIGFDVTGQ